jgi:hypothetical protein
MDKELGELVGKGFALLRDRLKAVEARKALDGIDGQDGADGIDGVNGTDGTNGIDGKAGVDGKDGADGLRGKAGDSVKGDQGVQGDQGDKGETGDQGEAGEAGQVGPQGERGPQGKDGQAVKGDKGDKGDDGGGITSAAIDANGNLIITLDDGSKLDAGRAKGKDAKQFHGMIAGGPSTPRPSGVVELDFGASASTATVDVTGVSRIEAESVVFCAMRIQATVNHTVDDMLVDPIRLAALSIVPGVGFTIFGAMDNAPANGKYLVQWAL